MDPQQTRLMVKKKKKNFKLHNLCYNGLGISRANQW
jgi:hypothetical protein